MRISDWSSDVCSSDLAIVGIEQAARFGEIAVDRARRQRESPRDLLVGIAAPGKHHAIARTGVQRSEEHTSELQSLMRISYAVFCLKKKKHRRNTDNIG